MPIIYEPPKPHVCEPPPYGDHVVKTPDSTLPEVIVAYPIGTLWRCDDCGSIHELFQDDMSGHRYWYRLRGFAARRRLRQLNLREYLK